MPYHPAGHVDAVTDEAELAVLGAHNLILLYYIIYIYDIIYTSRGACDSYKFAARGIYINIYIYP